MVNQYCAHSFARNWQVPFFNQRKGENDHRKYFMINLHERILRPHRGLNPRPPGLQSDDASNWATETGCKNWSCDMCRLIWFFTMHKCHIFLQCRAKELKYSNFILISSPEIRIWKLNHQQSKQCKYKFFAVLLQRKLQWFLFFFLEFCLCWGYTAQST